MAPFASSICRFLQARLNQAVAYALLCAVGIGAVGMPVYQPLRKDRSTPFPCQDHACGCADAQSCWHSCCCHSNSEKVAWARRHNVTPPRFVMEAAEVEACEDVGATACCSRHDQPCLTEESHHDSAQGRLGMVFMSNYLKCRGLSSLWTVLSQALVCEVERPTWTLQASGERVHLFSEAGSSLTIEPESPPPKMAL